MPYLIEKEGHCFDDTFPGRVVHFFGTGPWRLEEMINASQHHTEIETAWRESTGVFIATALSDNKFTSCGTKAIIKIWCQHDPATGTDNPKYLANVDDAPGSLGRDEFRNLQELIDHEVRSAPCFAEGLWDYQSDDMPFPGFQINYLVEEFLPGENLNNFFQDYSLAQREKIRVAFKKAIADITRIGMTLGDRAPRNVLYDSQSEQWCVRK
ncbi:MAG: hypothetical protein Q9162_005079 [Coniocarpon cinnabarinum]